MTTAALPQSEYEPPRRSWYKRNEIRVTPWLFLLPAILFFVVYVIFPIIQSFNVSAYAWDGLGEKEYVGLNNYRELWDDPAFYISLRNNLIWLVLYPLAIPAGLFIALFLNQTVTGIRLYKSLFFFPFVISQVVVGLVFTWFYDPTFGLMNTLLGLVGLGPINVLGRSDLCHLRHHRRRPLAADGLLHDPLPDRPERGRSRAGRGGAAGRGQGLEDALVRDHSAAETRDLHRLRGDHRRGRSGRST